MHEAPRKHMTSSGKRPLTRWILHVGLMLVFALAAGRTLAESPFSFDATPGKLPKTVVPLHYALDLTPDLDKLTFSGSESVDVEVTAPTERLVLNAVDMTIEAAAVDSEAASEIISDAAGNRQKASAYFGKLVDLAKNADTERPEIREAKAFLARR